MAGVFFQLRENKSKFHQIIYLAYKFGKFTFRYNTGIKLLPLDWNIKKGCTVYRAEPLDVEFIPSFIPYLDKKPKTSDTIDKVITDLKTAVNSFIYSNTDTLTKETLKAYLDSLYNENDGEFGEFANELNDYIRLKLLKDFRANKSDITKVEFIEKIETFLAKAKITDIEQVEAETLTDYIERFIIETIEGKRLNDGAMHNPRSIQRYRTTQKLFNDYCIQAKANIDFKDIDIKFYNDFNSYMAKVKDYTPATMGKHITTLKTFLKEATEAGINTHLKYQSKGFKAFETESESIALTRTEIMAIYNLDFTSNHRLDRVRDAFVLGCETGLRWSDFTDIKPQNIKTANGGGYNIDIIQEKTKKQVVIPASKIVLEILAKYNNQFPEPISNQKFNNYLKEIGQMVDSLHNTETMVITKGGRTFEETKPRWQMVSSHTARRSFATNEYEKGVPTLSIMAITGHKTEKSFIGYVKTDKSTHADILRKYQK